MNKDVIYIDVEDDVTSIIGKIKASKEKIVALVPPKRSGVLQSAVNLRLLERMAGEGSKHLVIITGNRALSGLAGAAGIPVARTLTSKPEIVTAAIEEESDGDDVIDGKASDEDAIPVVDHSTNKPAKATKSPKEDVIEGIAGDEDAPNVSALSIDELEVPVAVAAVRKKNEKTGSKKNNIKIPNFDTFRKRLFIGGAVLIALIAFLIWANVFAPAATIVITARTTSTPISADVNLGDSLTTDVSKQNLKTVTKQLKQDQTVQFTATGQADKGSQAVGTVTFTNDSFSAVTVPAQTQLTAQNENFTTDKAVTVPGGACSDIHHCHSGTADVAITAVSPGPAYNLNGPVNFTSNQSVSATSADGTSGGTSNIVTVVSADDITKATAQLAQVNNSTYQSQLTKQFDSTYDVIGDSFTAATATPVSTPAVGQEVTGQATLTATTTFNLSAVSKTDVESFLKDQLATSIGTTADQRVYDDGIKSAKIDAYTKSADGSQITATITSTGQVGPNINDATVKKQSEGKIYGDVQSNLQSIDGVESVDVKFSFFWVTKVPNDPNKIHIQFQLDHA